MSQLTKFVLGAILATLVATAQGAGIITTIAGGGGPNNVQALSSNIIPTSVAVDHQGNWYIASTTQFRVFKVDVAGNLTIIAGTGNSDYSGDGGPATAAGIGIPQGVAVDSSGNLYIADGSYRIRRVDAVSHTITTVAGNGEPGFSGDGGPATAASLYGPSAVALDGSGNLYISDSGHERVRRVDAKTQIITTVAGNGGSNFFGEGWSATNVSIVPTGIALDGKGNLYIADPVNLRVLRVKATGQHNITTVAGNGSYGFSGDGEPATSATLNAPVGVALDGSGNLYIADRDNNRVRRVDAKSQVITTLAGNGTRGFGGDGGPAAAASLNNPQGIVADGVGNLYVADTYNLRLRRINLANQIISTVAGNGTPMFSGDGGPSTGASLSYTQGVGVDTHGNIYIADTGNNRIRRVDAATNVISSVAGNGIASYSGDNDAASIAGLNNARGVAADNIGNLYIADTSNNRIRRVDAATQTITTVAGNGAAAFGGDGSLATSASLSVPSGIALDGSGNLFIADTGNQRIRRVDAVTQVITTVAGSDSHGPSGDGVLATVATLVSPTGVALDVAGNLYIADSYVSTVRRVDAATQIITTVAGVIGSYAFSGDGGVATAASLSYPQGVALDAAGNLYIADTYNNRIRRIDATTQIITTVAGGGSGSTFSGDGGPATLASLSLPAGVAIGANGDLYIADSNNRVIRKVTN